MRSDLATRADRFVWHFQVAIVVGGLVAAVLSASRRLWFELAINMISTVVVWHAASETATRLRAVEDNDV